MHPWIVIRLAEDRRRDLLAEAAADRAVRHHRPRAASPATRRRVGRWIVAVGTWVGGSPEPARCSA